MNQHPILFNGDMVRAILNGSKTQTRRIVKVSPNEQLRLSPFVKSGIETRHGYEVKNPYGNFGDQLWVRETWQAWSVFDGYKAEHIPGEARQRLNYPASGNLWGARQRPSIHMPRWASRITLEITNIRVEQLHDISEEDALSEGAIPLDCDHARHSCEEIGCYGDTAKAAFRGIWESTGGAWNANPWVWVIEFKRVQP